MTMIIVPRWLIEEIDSALDDALDATPAAAKDREALFDQLLAYYDEHGELPAFALVPR